MQASGLRVNPRVAGHKFGLIEDEYYVSIRLEVLWGRGAAPSSRENMPLEAPADAALDLGLLHCRVWYGMNSVA